MKRTFIRLLLFVLFALICLYVAKVADWAFWAFIATYIFEDAVIEKTSASPGTAR